MSTVTHRFVHLFAWISFFVFWREYYSVVDPHEVVTINAMLCTLFAMVSFYFTYFLLLPKLSERKQPKFFFLIFALTVLVLGTLRSAAIFIAFHSFKPATGYWEIFRSLSTSYFHIGYAMTVAWMIRLFTGEFEGRRRIAELEKERLKTELTYLKNQINPHFLFNIHNSIYFLIQEHSPLASEAVLKLSEIMRYQLYECDQDWVPLSMELDNIRNYIDLEKIRAGDNLQVDYRWDIKSGAKSIAPFILITFVENCFKHISNFSTHMNTIAIDVTQDNDWMIFNAINSVDPSNDYHRDGIGLKNLKRRLELLYTTFYTLEINLQQNYFNVNLKLLLK